MVNDSNSYLTSISHARAQKIIIQKAQELFDTSAEVADINNCLNRVLATDVQAKINVPAFDNSAMDGYAIRYSDLADAKQGWLALQKPQYAGSGELQVLAENSAIPIMTGALIPQRANTIVIKENSQIKDNQVHLRDIGEKGDYIRTIGADIKANSTILKQNIRLKAQDIGLISSVGCQKIAVYPKTKIVLFTGGDEVIQVGEPLEQGKVYDSVRSTLKGLLQSQNCEIIHVGNIQDDPAQIKQTLDKYAQPNTVIICNGGVSAGDKDYVLKVMQEHGQIAFHKVNVKPGFPLLFGQYNDALFFGLPGNPVSSFTSFCQFVIPALRLLEGETITPAGFIRAKLTKGYSKQHYRREFVRARFSYDPTIGFEVCISGNQSSGRLTSVTQANCFIILDETPNDFHAGDTVNIQRFVDLLYPHLI
ncbi:Molybdopterin molybdenumtransferase [hydrothermal vent metagenome]|uniref:molybdopterin molybdotransferase n=1 Tax=hydrothermal vent metagenome TaxID=652676 RepID=A0A3B0USX8_9ZZZZ